MVTKVHEVQVCPLCGEVLATGEGRTVAAHDLRGWPARPPAVVMGHRLCVRSGMELPIFTRDEEVRHG